MNKEMPEPSQPSVVRLSLYRDAIQRFKSYRAKWVMSDDIASSLGIKPAQVRKDLSIFGISGKRKAGYNVSRLFDSFNILLGKTEINEAILAGIEPFGRAMMREKIFSKQNIRITAAFDDIVKNNQTTAIGLGIPVRPVSEMISYIRRNHIRYGVIAAAPELAQRLADYMVMSGIEGILSLSITDIMVPSHVVLNTINFGHELERVIYFVNHGRKVRKEGIA